MGDVGHKFPPGLLALALLGDVVDDHHHAAAGLVGGKGRHKELQLPFPRPFLALQIFRTLEGEQGIEGGVLAEDGGEGIIPGELPREHAAGGGVVVDEMAGGIEGRHAVGHVEEEGGELVALVFHLGDGALEHLGHVVKVPGEHADLIPAGDLQGLGELTGGHLTGAGGEGANGRDQNLG